MTHVLVTHAPEDARAALVAEKLGALGFEIRQGADIHRALSPFERRKLKAEIDAAACVLVLWSREAADAPALRATAERAQASGKLMLARLDSAALPVGFNGTRAPCLANWLGRGQTRAWRQLVASIGTKAKKTGAKRATPRTSTAHAPAAAPEKKKGVAGGLIVTLLLLAALGGGAYYAWSTGLLAQWGVAL